MAAFDHQQPVVLAQGLGVTDQAQWSPGHVRDLRGRGHDIVLTECTFDTAPDESVRCRDSRARVHHQPLTRGGGSLDPHRLPSIDQEGLLAQIRQLPRRPVGDD
jgi:hypothetical protein